MALDARNSKPIGRHKAQQVPSHLKPVSRASRPTAADPVRMSPLAAQTLRQGDHAPDREDSSPVKETHHISIDYNPVSGRKCLNKYEILRELGRGQHGKVKLGFDTEYHRYVAIKTVNRKDRPRLGRPQGSTTEEKIRREIAILKKCSHPNIVQLFEVLDDSNSRKIYLVLEYCAKGEVKWQKRSGKPALSRNESRAIMRDVMLGLEYLHENGIVHRDIKPANLLVDDDNTVKISDFGVSYAMTGDAATDFELAKTVGTPAFFAPEMCVMSTGLSQSQQRAISAKIDVWAMGVTLFCFLYGHLLYDADYEYELFRVIATEPVVLPPPPEGTVKTAEDEQDWKLATKLLMELLEKDPVKRITISEAKEFPWLAQGLSAEQRSRFLKHKSDHIEVSSKDLNEAVSGVSFTGRIRRGLHRLADTLSLKPPSASSSSSITTSATAVSQRRSRAQSAGGAPSSQNASRQPVLHKLYKANSEGSHSLSGSSSISSLTRPSSKPTSRAASIRSTSSERLKQPSLPASGPSSRFSIAEDADSSSSLRMHPAKSMVSTISSSSMSLVSPQLPELDLPVLDVWSSSSSTSSTSSDEDDTGELTLVLGRGRTRSDGNGNRMFSSPSRSRSRSRGGEAPAPTSAPTPPPASASG